MGYVSHIFMYMDIRKHINLVKNHGYEGKIGMIKKDVHGIVMLAAKAGDIVLYRPYNADINGAIGIGRKVFGDSYVSKIIGSGLAFNPVRVNIL